MINSIKIKHLNIDNYIFNFEINPDQVWGIFSKNKNIMNSFANQVSGVLNNNNTCFVNDGDLFDNKEYFKARVYLDFNDKYINTIKVKSIKEEICRRYKKIVSADKFNQVIKSLNIRTEMEIKHRYNFTKVGNTFLNCAFAYAIEKRMLIVSNPTVGVKDFSEKQEIARRITDIDAGGIAVIMMDSLECFKGTLDSVVLVDDYNNVRIIDPSKDVFVLVEDYPSDEDILKEKVFRTDSGTIILNLDKGKLKECKRLGKCETLSFYQLETCL